MSAGAHLAPEYNLEDLTCSSKTAKSLPGLLRLIASMAYTAESPLCWYQFGVHRFPSVVPGTGPSGKTFSVRLRRQGQRVDHDVAFDFDLTVAVYKRLATLFHVVLMARAEYLDEVRARNKHTFAEHAHKYRLAQHTHTHIHTLRNTRLVRFSLLGCRLSRHPSGRGNRRPSSVTKLPLRPPQSPLCRRVRSGVHRASRRHSGRYTQLRVRHSGSIL